MEPTEQDREILNKIAEGYIRDTNKGIEDNKKNLNHLEDEETNLGIEMRQTEKFLVQLKNQKAEFEKNYAGLNLNTNFSSSLSKPFKENTFYYLDNIARIFKYSSIEKQEKKQNLSALKDKLSVYEKLQNDKTINSLNDSSSNQKFNELKNLKLKKKTALNSFKFSDLKIKEIEILKNLIKKLEEELEKVILTQQKLLNYFEEIKIIVDYFEKENSYLSNYTKNLHMISTFKFEMMEKVLPVPKQSFKYRDEERQCIEKYCEDLNVMFFKYKSKKNKTEQLVQEIKAINDSLIKVKEETEKEIKLVTQYDEKKLTEYFQIKEELAEIQFTLEYLSEEAADIPKCIQNLKEAISQSEHITEDANEEEKSYEDFLTYHFKRGDYVKGKLIVFRLNFFKRRSDFLTNLLECGERIKLLIEKELDDLRQFFTKEGKEYYDKFQIYFEDDKLTAEAKLV